MSIELGFNSNLLSYNIKRNNSEKNYIYNDTDLSFIKESSYNGRGLLTIFIFIFCYIEICCSYWIRR